MRYAMLVLSALVLATCSDGGDTDQGPPPGSDGPVYPDLGQLWPCDDPGKPCNAHNPCAIDAICGEDGYCRPTAMQTCDDGLDCTDDICKGMGLCEYAPKAGWCALPVSVSSASDAGAGGKTEIQCFKEDEANPTDQCLVCQPDNSADTWSQANGGACDDGDPCTKDDYCQTGVCKGVYYGTLCADDYSCTTDLCDGNGGCLGYELMSGWCLINGACYKDQASHPDGSCNICDVKTSTNQWTPISDTCMIDSKCYNAKASHPSGTCAECDPATSTTSWTPTGNGCLIDDTCYQAGDIDSIGCSQCDPNTSTTAWTPLTGVCLIDGKCYQPGDKNPSGSCSECDPTKSATSWSPIANTCFIDGACYNANDPHPQGCAKCDPASSDTSWTVTDAAYCVVAGTCVEKATSIYACGACGVACGPGESCSGGKCSCGSLVGTVGGGPVCPASQSCDQGQCVNLPPGTLAAPFSLDFELADGSLTGTKDWEWGKIGTWSPSSNCDSTTSTEPPAKGHSGTGVWATKLNDCYSPLDNASSTCSNADTTDDSVLSFKVKIPGNWTKATLTYWEWFDLFLTFDWGEIRVDGTVVNQSCTGSKASPVVWAQKSVDLTPYVGKIITVAFHMMATSVVQYSGWYIDDLSVSGS
jgi:hypothetical protein